MSELNIISSEDASRYVMKNWFFHELVRRKTYQNIHGNHIRLHSQKTGKRFHIKFARELFKTFSKHCENAEEGELGESMDVKAIEDMDDDDLIFFAQPDAIRYIFYGDLKEQGEIRTNNHTNEETYSIGINKLMEM